jgi:hypothetical protein
MAGPESTYETSPTSAIQTSDDIDQDLFRQAERVHRALESLARTPVFAEGVRVREWEVLTEALIVNTQMLASDKRGEIAEISTRLEELRTSLGDRRIPELLDASASLAVIFEALRLNTVLLMALSSLGECRMETPYSRLRPVIRSDGQRVWCCSHKQEHCR